MMTLWFAYKPRAPTKPPESRTAPEIAEPGVNSPAKTLTEAGVLPMLTENPLPRECKGARCEERSSPGA